MGCCAPSKITIGLWMILCSVILSGIGVLFAFNKAILAAGNILLVPGLILTFELKTMLRFFQQSFKGSICLALGFLCVIIGLPIIGVMFESSGFIVLLCEFCRAKTVSLLRLPVSGQTFDESSLLQPSNESSRLRQVTFCLGFCLYLVFLFMLVILAIVIETKFQTTIFSIEADMFWEEDVCQLD